MIRISIVVVIIISNFNYSIFFNYTIFFRRQIYFIHPFFYIFINLLNFFSFLIRITSINLLNFSNLNTLLLHIFHQHSQFCIDINMVSICNLLVFIIKYIYKTYQYISYIRFGINKVIVNNYRCSFIHRTKFTRKHNCFILIMFYKLSSNKDSFRILLNMLNDCK